MHVLVGEPPERSCHKLNMFQELQTEGGNIYVANQIAAVVKICLASTSQCLGIDKTRNGKLGNRK